MGSGEFRFKEIEHKYVVGDAFDLPRFRDTLAALGPHRTSAIRVRDCYYLIDGSLERRFVICTASMPSCIT